MKHIGRKILVPAVGLALAGGGFAFLSGGSVGPSYASASDAAIGGYNATSVHYVTANDPEHSTITGVQFSLDHPVSTDNVSALVYDQTRQFTTVFDTCTSPGGATPRVTCTSSTNQTANNYPTTDDLTNLEVRAAS